MSVSAEKELKSRKYRYKKGSTNAGEEEKDMFKKNTKLGK